MTPDTLLYLAAFVLVFPMLGFVINIFFGKRLGRISGWLAVTIVGIDVLLSVFILYTKLTTFADVSVIQTKISWLNLGSSNIKVGILIDNLAAMMLIVVTLISFLVHLFSTEYMADDKRYSRYFAYLGLFTFSMLGIVIANNFLFMYIFWELVGVSSYLLIGFWYEKKSASDAGKKAFLVNRIGDFGFFAGILILFFTYNTVFFDEIFAGIAGGHLPFNSGFWLTLSGVFIFCGAIGKSAQFPLHVWLPDAMEGPTPVSALIHAATMVAAGVYLVARVFPMFSADALTTIAYVGAFTAFMSATIAITQVDFKRVLAYSTVSQLGFMIMSLGACSYTTGFFHLVTHAWFKAALFLASGSVIHAMHHSMHKFHDHHTDPQDINNMGGLRRTMPLTYMTFLFATFALSGVPLTSGFLSKDGILAGTLAFAQLSGHWFIPLAGFAAAGMTAFYMFRLTIVAFHGEHKTEIAKNTHENKFVIVFPLVLLAVLSFWFFYSPNPTDANKGWFVKNLPVPQTAVPAKYQFNFLTPTEKGENPYLMAMGHKCKEGECKGNCEHHKKENVLASGSASVGDSHSSNMQNTKHETSHSSGHKYFNKFEEQMHHAHLPAMILSIIIAGLGILFSFMVYQFKIFNADNMAKQFSKLHQFSYRKWYIDEIYHATVVAGTVGLSKVLAWFDLYLIDGLVNLTAFMTRGFSYFIGHFDNIVIDGFVNLSANVTGFFGAMFRKVQTGRVQTYLVFVVIGVMLLIYFFV
ncbi:MAG: NADH-quinone oxidoreductase subunit L [Bacteroidetes bacterium]|nr:MAG: NADH-quinone oxidoreductase subunit L [Bacteroidota bacterium]